MDDPIKLFAVIALISLPTVMFGGYALLRLLGKERLSDFQVSYFRAGHAHAGVLLVLALVVLEIVGRTNLGTASLWAIGVLLVVGILSQSGGMFIHMAIGQPGEWSLGNTLTTTGGLLLGVAMFWVAYGLIVT